MKSRFLAAVFAVVLTAGTLTGCGSAKTSEPAKTETAKENSVSCITFNLGYLPGGDHTMATKSDSSIAALTQGLSLLKKGGLISLCIYSGGDSGFEERDAVLTWLATLDPHKYLVIRSDYYNRPNHPPIPVLIIKL